MKDAPNSNRDPLPDADPDMLRTDPQQRRNVLLLIGAMAAGVLLLWAFGLPALRRWTDVSDPALMIHRVDTVFYWLSVMLYAGAGYAGWYAVRIFRSSQFPPPGSWVLRDTRLLRGDPARARGLLVIACAISLVLLAAYVTILPSMLKPPHVHHRFAGAALHV
ncbi:MAG TPA: hypothetical protein VK660_04230 [Xanthomonadaceae bacterium]|jgi:hypothetical protein|nr:hypothetical protein [Xanthomonadaceae bacterium]